MINNVFCRDPGPTLIAIFGLGIAVGLLLAVWIMYLYWILERHTERRNWKALEQAALAAQEERDVVIDDDRMMCEACWEERHPGLNWPFSGIIRWTRLCKMHAEARPYEPTTGEEILYALVS